MKNEEIKDILNNAELIGRWEDKALTPGYEELYLGGTKEDSYGYVYCQFYLYGPDGINSPNWIVEGIDSAKTDRGEKLMPINPVMARMWTARFLTDEVYEKVFGKSTTKQKAIDNLSPNDLYLMFDSVLDFPYTMYSRGMVASGNMYSQMDMHSAISKSEIYDLAARMWDFAKKS